jgi:hypothetical protein
MECVNCRWDKLSKITSFHQHTLQILKAFCSICGTKLPLNIDECISRSHSSALCSSPALRSVYTKGILYALKHLQFVFFSSKHGCSLTFSKQTPLMLPWPPKCLLVALTVLGHVYVTEGTLLNWVLFFTTLWTGTVCGVSEQSSYITWQNKFCSCYLVIRGHTVA